MRKYKVSVIIPIYGVEKYLKKCVDSLIKQNFDDYEILLIDDGSPDKCGEICDNYSNEYDNIYAFHKENGGLSSARNYGIKRAKGEYLIFVDSDDFVSENMISILYNSIKNDCTDIAICNRFEYLEYNNKCKKSYVNNYKHEIFNYEQAIMELCSFQCFDMSAWAKIYKRELFEDIEFPEGKLSEDYYIMYRLFEKCNSISYINEYLYYYVQRKGSISKNKKINYDYMEAAKQQMLYIESKYENLKKYVRTAYLLSNITIFDWYIKNKRTLPTKAEYKRLKNEVKNNLEYLKQNEKISASRKIQANFFVFNKYIYSVLFKIYNIIKG